MIAMLGPTKNTIWLQRGYRHYGQPIEETLEGFKEIVEDENDSYFKTHKDRLCICNCEHCTKISPHPVNNCHYRCKLNLLMDDK